MAMTNILICVGIGIVCGLLLAYTPVFGLAVLFGIITLFGLAIWYSEERKK